MLRRYLRSMGSCIGYNNRGSRGSESSEDNPTMTHNRPLKHRKPKWKSNIRLTENQLRAKREEFWDTAPAFEGRREIWDALKASVAALESGDYQMAQVILDGANISLPNGTLMECYDELGNRYQLPVYILSAPINMIQEGDEEEEEGEEDDEAKLKSQGGRKKEQEGKQINIRIRFSTGEDRKLTVNTSENVAAVKRSLARCSPGIDPNAVRFFFAGKQLFNKMTLASAKVESNYTIQALIMEQSPSHTPALQPLKCQSERHQGSSKPHKQTSMHKSVGRPKVDSKRGGKEAGGEGVNGLQNIKNCHLETLTNVNDAVNTHGIISPINNNNNNKGINCNYNSIQTNILYNYKNESLHNETSKDQHLLTSQEQQQQQHQSELSDSLYVSDVLGKEQCKDCHYKVDGDTIYPMCSPLCVASDQENDMAKPIKSFLPSNKLQTFPNCQQHYRTHPSNHINT